MPLSPLLASSLLLLLVTAAGSGMALAPASWPAGHLPRWLFSGLAVLMGALVWIVLLRLQVRRQTARLVTANEELERLGRQLRASLEQERQMHESQRIFLNTITHEFRTPLGIILFASSMMRRFEDRFGPEERAQQLDTIDEAVKRMDELVEQALSLGRAEAAQPDLRPLDLLSLCHRVVDEVQSATRHRCRIWLSTDGHSYEGCTDEALLRTILVNLLGNAVKYSPAGSQVILRLTREDADAVFTVRDHGPGLREEDLPNLFKSFHRGRSASGTPGTGLGLSIVKRCAESMGGSVSARNAEDGGAEFTVRLRVAH